MHWQMYSSGVYGPSSMLIVHFNGQASELLYLVLAVRLASHAHLEVFPTIFVPEIDQVRIPFNVKVRVQVRKILQWKRK